MSNVYKKVLINELIRILKRSIRRKLLKSQRDENYIKYIISQIVNHYPNCNECNANLIRMYNYSESIYEIREDWCIDYHKPVNSLYISGQIKGLICRNCNMQKVWNSMEIDSPINPEPMEID